MKKLLLSLLVLSVFFVTGCSDSTTSTNTNTGNDTTTQDDVLTEDDTLEEDSVIEGIKESFLSKALEVSYDDESVTFKDASSVSDTDLKTVSRNPEKVAILYGSYTALWYEAGGVADGVIGGTSVELYEEQIGRDITQDEGMTVLSTSAAASRWSLETIVAFEADLIICSTAMSGYSTISAIEGLNNTDIIAVDYDDVSDYLKWFRVFSLISGNEELYEEEAIKIVDNIAEIISLVSNETSPTAASLFGTADLQFNLLGTTVGSMMNDLGANNVADTFENESGATRIDVNLETLYAVNPTYILVQCHDTVDTAKAIIEEAYGTNAVWNLLDAVNNDNVYYLEKGLFHNKANKRFDEAYLVLAEILYPNIDFSNIVVG